MELVFILVSPAVPGNVGAAARAMKTMGFTEMRLVNPCDHLSTEALMLAHGANDILHAARIYTDFEQALTDVDFVIGTTAKNRRVKNDFHTPRELPAILEIKRETVRRAAIVFGREESGLRNEEMELCDLLSTVPMAGSYPSLNLAQAVMLYAWELSAVQRINAPQLRIPEEGSLKAIRNKIRDMLASFGLDEESIVYPRILERIMLLGDDDLHLLHTVHKAWENSGKNKIHGN
ncbi:MAG: tRNA/rRNA methyltransferase [Bacteroidales bacterium]